MGALLPHPKHILRLSQKQFGEKNGLLSLLSLLLLLFSSINTHYYPSLSRFLRLQTIIWTNSSRWSSSSSRKAVQSSIHGMKGSIVIREKKGVEKQAAHLSSPL